ncbi:MAG: hypothetical protein QG597_3852 [Actinomycetota bacterium]|nr:hypothetical protein [Actinomycetota bacterium]
MSRLADRPVQGDVQCDGLVEAALPEGGVAVAQEASHAPDVLLGAAGGGESRGPDLQGAADLQHVDGGRVRQTAADGPGEFAVREDVGARTLSPLQQTGVDQGLDGLPHGVPAGARQLRELGLGGDAVADGP